MAQDEFFENRFYIVFSEWDEDETGKGWYAQDCDNGWRTTPLFATELDLQIYLACYMDAELRTTPL